MGGKSAKRSATRCTAYSAVVVNGIPVPAYIIFSCFYDPFGSKNDIGTGIHMTTTAL